MAKKEKGNKNKKQDTRYNAENEIIIGVTTKPKEKVRVDKKKTTRTSPKTNKSKNTVNRNKKINSKSVSNKEYITKEKEIKKLNKKKIVISIIFFLILLAGGTIYYLTTPVFNISSIVVYGNEKNSADTYISLSGINLNSTNIFAFTKNGLKEKIKENPYVDNVRVERKFPNTIELYITERKVDYQINYLDSYIYLSNQGYVLEINEEKKKVPLIEGLEGVQGGIKAGQRLENNDLIKLDTILKVTNYLKYNSVESVLTGVNVEDTTNYILEFEKEGKKAYIGDSSSITEKMTSVAQILKAEKKNKGIIHATEEELRRNRVYFTQLEEE